MKNRLAILLLLLIIYGCMGADIIYVVNSQSRTLSRIDTVSDLVQNTFSILGNVPNKVVIGPDYLYAVNSGDNSIQKIDKTSGSTVANHLVAVGSNPWDAVLHEGNLYISGLFSSKVYKMDAGSGTVIANVTVGTAPEALKVVEDKLYVSNAGNYGQNYAGSSVSVIDLPSFSVVDTIEVGLNPQFFHLQGRHLHVSCTGNWTDVGGSIAVVDTDTGSVIHTIELGGTPGNLWIDSQAIAWVADNAGYELYRYQADDFEILNAATNPLPVAASDIAGTSQYLAVLTPDWGSNARVRLLDDELSQIKDYTVGMMPTDMKLEPAPTSLEDEVLSAPVLTIYPNPLRQGQILSFKGIKSPKGIYRIFNLRGQLLQEGILESKGIELDSQSLPTGCYIYQIQAGQRSFAGKFVITK
jgi:hypothetical protein